TSGNPSLRELIGRVRGRNLAAYGHQDVPFERLIEELNPSRSLSHHPLFQVMLALQNNAAVEVELAGLRSRVEEVCVERSKFDLSVSVAEERGADGTPAGISGVIEYASDLFDRGSVEALGSRFVRLLEGAVAAPDVAIGRLELFAAGGGRARLELLSAGERRQVLEDWNATGRAVARGTLVDELAAQAAARPDAVAAVFEDARLSYGELDARANQLAHHLRALGVGAETVVGLCLERSLEMLVGLIGILKAGGAYLPLDPTYPAERLGFMLEDAGAALVITSAALGDRLGGHGARRLELDAQASALAAQPTHAPAITLQAQNLAYVIYTSGSTGTPKGVAVTHGGLNNVLLAMQEEIGLTSHSRVLQFASLSFDAAVSELVIALGSGATLVIAAAQQRGDGLAGLIREQSVTHATLPPVLL